MALTDEQERQAVSLQAKGWAVHRIAREVGAPYGDVYRLLRSVNRRLGRLMILDRYAAEERGRQIQLLAHLYEDLQGRWERAPDSIDPKVIAELRAILGDVRTLLELNKEAIQAASITGHHHRIPDVDERFLGAGGHPAVAGVEDGDAPA